MRIEPAAHKRAAMSPDVRASMAFADRYAGALHDVVMRCAPAFVVFTETTLAVDRTQGADYVLTLGLAGEPKPSLHVAARVRRASYRNRYHDVTIRAATRTGAETERDKITNGAADLFVYAWAEAGAFVDHVAFDCHVLRARGVADALADRRVQFNDDGSGFVTASVVELADAGALMDCGAWSARDLASHYGIAYADGWRPTYRPVTTTTAAGGIGRPVYNDTARKDTTHD